MFGISGWGTVQISFIICISLKAIAQIDNLCAGNANSDICHKLGENYYLIDTNNTFNWFNAERFCRRQKGFLANISNATEMNLITDYLLANNLVIGSRGVWIGASDLGSEGTFYTTEYGEAMPYTRWKSGEPNNLNGRESCVLLRNYGGVFLMNDQNCFERFFYVCQLRKTPQWHCASLLSKNPTRIDLRHH